MARAGWSGAGGWLRALALALVVSLALVACGRDEEEPANGAANGDNELDARNETPAVQTIFDASPEALASPSTVDLPQDAGTATVSIEDGKLDPDTVEGQVGQPFILTVTGDGQAHTLEIEGLVNETSINPQGETLGHFTVGGEAGDRRILLDGNEAGTLKAQSAGGITD